MKNSLKEVHPELVSEWSEKNLPLTPEMVSYGSNKVVWWRGKCGHEWETSVKARSKGESCPICEGIRIVEGINDLAMTHPLIAAEWSPRNLPLQPTMVGAGSHKKVWWRDKLGHEWKAEVRARVRGTGCPYCSHNKILEGFNDLAPRFPEVPSEWSERNLPLLPTMVTAFANKKVWWKCSKGHEWYTLISTRTGKGSQCPYCSGFELLKGFNDFATRQPELAEEWSDRNLPLTPDMVNEKSTKKVWWKCKVCGFEWQSLVKSRIKGTVCPVCADRAVKEGYNDLMTTDPEVAGEWDIDKNKGIRATQVSRYSLRSVWWKGSCGHSWKDKVSNRTVGDTACIYCEKDFHKAFPLLLAKYYGELEGVKVKIMDEETVGVPLDIYIPELRLAFGFRNSEAERTKDEQRVIKHICEARRIFYVAVKDAEPVKVAIEVRKGFAMAHTYINTDIEVDCSVLRERYLRWRKQVKI